ncbi:MAG: Xaa-Pro aminopeptidase [Erysipelotrichaceae bacterium]|nr:Xaa-Pro aminopeptidase [Erysipelotrichaceae bacterium]
MNLYSKRREMLLKNLGPNSVVILFSSDAETEEGRFKINRNFYYLTGIDKKQMILVLMDKAGVTSESLFILPYDETEALWVGGRISAQEASETADIKDILNYNDFDSFMESTLSRFRGLDLKVYLDSFVDENGNVSKSSEYANELLTKYPHLTIKDLFPYTTRMRLIKDDYEITCIKQANNITKQGIQAMMKSIKPGLNEMTMEGVFTFSCNQNVCNEFAFKTIAASGPRATTLHYSDNNQIMQDGELFLQDLGATFKHYCADVTRTYPVNGKFTERQKELYQIVLNVQKLVEQNARVGVKIRDLNRLVIQYYKQELPKHGLTKDVSEYYYHNISHHLGLDCHDADGGLGAILEAGNVISNEPGLYVADEGIGIRIEDDLLITGTGAINLSKDIIKEIDDIENFMNN